MYINHGSDQQLIENLWNGLYSDHKEEFASAFREANKLYRDQLYTFQMKELERISDTPAMGRMFIESYEDCMGRFDNKLKRNYRFIVNPKKEQMMNDQAIQRLLERVEQNIRKRELQGIN